MKTATLGINPNCSRSPPLGEAENETIKDVIKRAEQLDINEKERVRFLVSYYYVFIFFLSIKSNIPLPEIGDIYVRGENMLISQL